jgi:hypothetical protein
MNKSVTVDFDNTLSRKDVQEYVKELISKGIDVWVLTSRYDELHKHRYIENPQNEDLYTITDELGIPRHKIRFTNMVAKHEYLFNTNVIWHLDDDRWELEPINKYTKTKGISVYSGNFKNKCNKLLFNSKL